MRVRAKCWVNTGDEWHAAGTEFEVSKEIAEQLGGAVEIIKAPPKTAKTEPAETDTPEEPVKKTRGRPKKTTTED